MFVGLFAASYPALQVPNIVAFVPIRCICRGRIYEQENTQYMVTVFACGTKEKPLAYWAEALSALAILPGRLSSLNS